jgi:hypothetical protein
VSLATESREAIVAALTGHGYKIYDTVPATPITPSVVCVPDSPWIRPSRLGSNLNYEIRWRILININARVNESATKATEDAIDALLVELPNTVLVELINAPQLLSIGAQGTVMSTEINVSMQMKEG